MTSIARAKFEADHQAVMETVVYTISDENKEDNLEDTGISSNSLVNDINFNNDPYYKFDISDPYFDSQPGWKIGCFFSKKKYINKFFHCKYFS